MAKKRQYTDEFKREAVSLCGSGSRVGEVARDLDIDASMLRRWVRQARSNQPSGGANVEDSSELQKVRAQLRQVTMERDILKKALGYFARNPQ